MTETTAGRERGSFSTEEKNGASPSVSEGEIINRNTG
jgi:hypothetical protein